MAIASRTIMLLLFLLLVCGVGGILLQIFLSKRENKWLGLILPLLTFLNALLNVLAIADTGSTAQNVLLVLTTVLVGNIPTLILLAIYWAAREKRRIKSQMDKMNIDDL